MSNHVQKIHPSTEFKYDQKIIDPPFFIPPAPAAPVQLLEVFYNNINPGDNVSLNGVISVNSNNTAAVATITLSIVRTSLGSTPQVIYTQVFELDNEGDDDLVLVPLAHVDVATNRLSDVRYTLQITTGSPNILLGLFQNTLTATRFRNGDVLCTLHESEKEKAYDKYERVELKYDERILNPGLPIPTPIPVSAPVLELDIDTINAYDRVWLSGIVNLNSNNAAVATVHLTITRNSPINATPVVIYSQDIEIDNEGDDDQVPIPFSHVDVAAIPLINTRYTVRLSSDIPNVIAGGVGGPLILTALRFS